MNAKFAYIIFAICSVGPNRVQVQTQIWNAPAMASVVTECVPVTENTQGMHATLKNVQTIAAAKEFVTWRDTNVSVTREDEVCRMEKDDGVCQYKIMTARNLYD